MKLITKEIERRLLETGRRPEKNPQAVVKFFDPSGPATWLITEVRQMIGAHHDFETGRTAPVLSHRAFVRSLRDFISVRRIAGFA